MTADPSGRWVEQLGRHLTDAWSGFLRSKTHLIHDRDPMFTRVFREILAAAGVQSVGLPPRSPNLNAFAERFVLSIKSDCLSRVVPLGERHLVRLIEEYVEHYHAERPHQGLGNVPPDGVPESVVGFINRRDRLGALRHRLAVCFRPLMTGKALTRGCRCPAPVPVYARNDSRCARRNAVGDSDSSRRDTLPTSNLSAAMCEFNALDRRAARRAEHRGRDVVLQDTSIYVVDDDLASRESLLALLDAAGHCAWGFSRPSDLLSSLEVVVPGLVLIDYCLPEMNGVELLREIVARGMRIPAILMTAYATVPIVTAAMRLGAVDVIEKPYAPTALLGRIAAARTRSVSCPDVRVRIHDLSAAEREMCELLIDGLSEQGIADRLRITRASVELQRKQLLDKLRISTSGTADAVAAQLSARLSRRHHH